MTLEIVKPEQLAKVTVNSLLYGPPKVGKTVGAASAPPPVLYLNAEMPNATRFAHGMFGDRIQEVRVKDLKTLIDVGAELKKQCDSGQPTWESVVVDPMGGLHRLVLEGESGRALSPSLPTYKDVQTHIERFCRFLCELPINVVFVAHETAEKDEATGAFEKLPFMGTSNNAPAAKLMEMVDVIGYCGVTEDEATKEPLRQAQVIAANGRKAGTRFEVLGKVRTLDLSEWVDTVAKAEAALAEAKQAENKKAAPKGQERKAA